MEKEKGRQRAEVTYEQRCKMNSDLLAQQRRLRKQGRMTQSVLCNDCFYLSRGFVCWSSNGECLRTRMMVLDGRGEELENLLRFSSLNQLMMPFQFYDFHNGCFGLAFRLSFASQTFKRNCQKAFNQFAADYMEPSIQDDRYTHGLPHEWKRIFVLAFQHKTGFSFVQVSAVPDGFDCFSYNLELLEEMAKEFLSICGDQKRFQSLVNRALEAMPPYWNRNH